MAWRKLVVIPAMPLSRLAAVKPAQTDGHVLIKDLGSTTCETFASAGCKEMDAVRGRVPAEQFSSIDNVMVREMASIDQLFGKISVAIARLERDFTVTGDGPGHNGKGAGSPGRFVLSHRIHGRLLSVDEYGNITLFDRNGGTMSTESYVRALSGEAWSSAPQRAGSKGAIVDRWL